jgi:predicted XRE-type DNA-binding protein
MSNELELVQSSDNPFRDAGLPEADTELMKADLASGILRILRQRELSGVEAARLAEVTEADISRIRRAALNRFSIDRLVRIPNRLDQGTRVRVSFSQPLGSRQTGPVHPSV